MSGGVLYRPSEHPHRCCKPTSQLEVGMVYGCLCGRRYVLAGLVGRAGVEAQWERTQVVRGWCDSHPGTLFLLIVAVMLVVAWALTAVGVIV